MEQKSFLAIFLKRETLTEAQNLEESLQRHNVLLVSQPHQRVSLFNGVLGRFFDEFNKKTESLVREAK